MRVHKKVLSRDTGLWLLCCWQDCERQGYELYKCVKHEINQDVAFVFCSERHRQYFLNSHRDNGNLPLGEKTRL